MNQNDPTFLQNQVDWLSLQMQEIARTLQLPADSTMKDLPEHAKKIMAELTAFRVANKK